MLTRLVITVAVIAGMGLLYLGWRYYKTRVVKAIRATPAFNGKPALLYFTGEYCAPCKFQQTPIIEQLAAKLGDAVAITMYDVSKHPDLARQYKILTLPATVILNKQGQVTHINYGVADQARLEAQLS